MICGHCLGRGYIDFFDGRSYNSSCPNCGGTGLFKDIPTTPGVDPVTRPSLSPSNQAPGAGVPGWGGGFCFLSEAVPLPRGDGNNKKNEEEGK